MNQQKLNDKVLSYFRERLKKYSYCTEDFIKSEELRAASIDNFELAEAINKALEQVQKDRRK